MNPRVSVVVPCYNGERFIDDFMKSVLALEYDNIQLIVTDDGSTDNSYSMLNSYREIIISKGIDYILLHKENGGQPSAFNTGIKKADGKYVVWPDVDDTMHRDFLSAKVGYMEKHPEIDFLLNRSAIVPLGQPDKIMGYTWPKPVTSNKELVDRILRDHDCWFEPGAFMVRASSLDRLIPGRHIYEKCGTWSGPQIQITFPFFYKGKIGYINNCLYDYNIHEHQHHTMLKDKEKLIRKNNEVKKVLIETIKSVHSKKEEEMIGIVNQRMIRSEAIAAFALGDRKWFDDVFARFDKDMIGKKDRIRHIIINNIVLYKLYRLYKKVWSGKKVLS